jgi:hypothetical protein
MMINDPHESGKRLDEFSKFEIEEQYLEKLNFFLANFDSYNLKKSQEFPIIYVVGLPRSGTTLLSQLISRYLPVGYINNLIARFWLNPTVGIRLSQAVLGDTRERIIFKSTHGVTEDPWGPHEFGYFWRHWLRLDESKTHKLSPEVLGKIDSHGLRSILEEMTSAFDAPMVFKNVICGLQASFLTRIYPNSVFVLIERDRGLVAKSILKARMERYGNNSIWWSLKPSTYDQIREFSDPEEQIARQLSDGAKDLQDELAKPEVNSIRLLYDDVCADPLKSLKEIVNATASFGYSIPILGKPHKLILSKA